jgi:hypothetical protein
MNKKKVEKKLRSALKVWQKEYASDFDNYDVDLIIRKSLFVKEKLVPLLKECYPSVRNATYFVCDKTQDMYDGFVHLVKGDEYVVIQFGDFHKYVNVSADSLVSITIDVLKRL